MDIVVGGISITIQNTLKRVRAIFLWVVTRAGNLLLKLPLASLDFLMRIGAFVLDGKNKRVVALVLTTAALMVASRTLVS